MYFLYLQFIELWDPASCQSLHVWICKTGYLQAGLCQQWAGQSWYCWKSRLCFKENNTSNHSDIWRKCAVHEDLEGDLPYLQEEDRTSEWPITCQWAGLPEQCICALQWIENRTLNKRCGHGTFYWKWRYCWVHSEQGWEKQAEYYSDWRKLFPRISARMGWCQEFAAWARGRPVTEKPV